MVSCSFKRSQPSAKAGGVEPIFRIASLEGGICTEVRTALGAVAPSPLRAKKAEEVIKGRPIGQNAAAEAAEQAVAGAQPLSRNRYKLEIVRALVKRAILG
jgi:CO/xanthine dehydrogenase FAD-binding subunit